MDPNRRTRPRAPLPAQQPQQPANPPQQPGYPQQPTYPPQQPTYPPQPPGYPPQQPGYPPQQHYPVPPPAPRRPARPKRAKRKPRRTFRLPGCCLLPALASLLLLLPLALYFFAPGRINLAILGIDYVDPANPIAIGRSDTLMMATIDPPRGYVGIISIPRDLWVTIPGLGENRINTAHFYAEGITPGSGPQAVRNTIKLNFGIDLPYYVRFRFESFREIVDAMGGVDINLAEPTAGYPAGRHHLTGRKALAFVRDRANSDDFFRMAQGQIMVKALMQNMLNPLKWPRLPGVARAFLRSVETNLPVWLWPRAGLAILRAGPSGIDSRIIDREMASGFTTSEGAMVLAPNWPKINALVSEIFH